MAIGEACSKQHLRQNKEARVSQGNCGLKQSLITYTPLSLPAIGFVIKRSRYRKNPN
ncbi:MAG: hypothetical protein KME54_08970 [Tolypothrix brevis GSE-NOS-MK-07-07A]|nr:hypothetical protein [Tolypothrix brevis GSE-NOS-MK-07-07A]